jgi:hypothetical protein
VQLDVDAAALGLKAGQPTATGLVAGRSLSCRSQDTKIEVSLLVGPRKCEVIRLVP